MARIKRLGWRVRLDVAARAFAAIVGGYVVTALAIGLAARHLPMAPAEATIASTLASFVLYAVILLAAFSVRGTRRVWVWTGATIAVLGAGLWLSIHLGGRV